MDHTKTGKICPVFTVKLKPPAFKTYSYFNVRKKLKTPRFNNFSMQLTYFYFNVKLKTPTFNTFSI